MTRVVPLLALAACAEAGFDSAFTDATTAGGTDFAGDGSSTPADTDATAPPEQEDDLFLLPPAQTDVYVFVANPDRDTVTRVNVRTLAVDTTSVGTDPNLVVTTPDYTTAVVFNRGDDSVTLVDAQTLEKRTVDVRDNLNDLVLSPDGAWAVLWHDAARERPDDPPPEGLQSFNEASFVHLASATHHPLAVGFDPRMVRFTPDGSLAVVVSDAYLSIVDLTGDEPTPRLVELQPGVLDPASAEEVIVAEDGSFAWVRQFGATELLVVDLRLGSVAAVPAGSNPTDLDLSPDGSEAVAVARGSSELWVYDARSPFTSPSVLGMPPEGAYGSLLFDPTGDQALLYTTSAALERYGVWDRATGAITEHGLVKPVAGMAITPTGTSAMVFHTLADGPDTEPAFLGKWALTLVDLRDFRSNPLLLPAEPLAYANATTGERGYFVMDGEPYFEVLDYTTLLHHEYELRSIPTFVGVLPDLQPEDGDEPSAWVSQEYDLGRISFFDPDDGSLETLTGFELNAGIEEEE